MSEAARQLGVHKSTVSRQVANGIIPNHGTDDKPLIDVEEARRARELGLDFSKQRAPAPAAAPAPREDLGPTYQGARGRREQALAEKAEIELKRLRGETLDRGEVTDAAFALGQMLREALETRRAALAQRLAGLEAGQILALLEDADAQHLAAFADAVESRFRSEEAVAA